MTQKADEKFAKIGAPLSTSFIRYSWTFKISSLSNCSWQNSWWKMCRRRMPKMFTEEHKPKHLAHSLWFWSAVSRAVKTTWVTLFPVKKHGLGTVLQRLNNLSSEREQSNSLMKLWKFKQELQQGKLRSQFFGIGKAFVW